ncbi:MAG: peptidoglycan-binding protein, partial [Sandaracinaceae bacterium]|nr:peptidoglycan-binding protein [Sandaracinaceae bacterium]
MNKKFSIFIFALAALALSVGGCASEDSETNAQGGEELQELAEPEVEDEPDVEPEVDLDALKASLISPVPIYDRGKIVSYVERNEAEAKGYLLIDLGDDWTPYILTERSSEDEEPIENPYRKTFLALAQGKFPNDHHGDRARRDRYLELYGIPPTLTVLRDRFEKTLKRDCDASFDREALEAFEGLAVYISNERAQRDANRYAQGRRLIKRLKDEQGVDDVDDLDLSGLRPAEQRLVREYPDLAVRTRAIIAAQDRLKCEGYLRGRFVRGAIDWKTHEALALFERRHRIYAWGFVGRETRDYLLMPAREADRISVQRVILERAIHHAGIIEDGSRSTMGADERPVTYVGADGKRHQVRNLVGELEARVVKAFALDMPEGALEFLRSLGSLKGHHFVAIRDIKRPEYYSNNMELFLEIDRGDVWYEFPYDEKGRERPQPVSRRPRITIYTKYLDQRIPLARFGTTIGGWRGEATPDGIVWRYKNSPTGRRIIPRIVAAPVWLPPETTPPRGLLTRSEKPGQRFEVNFHEMGPSYASAYGLVAAYHRRYTTDANGNIRILGDEGIRTHGSVDYMSIMRRHSHGCHRLHNHIAVRVMSFILRHRPHTRKGVDPIAFGRRFEYDGVRYEFLLTKGGYVYELDEPLFIDVLEGRIRGSVDKPIAHAIPRYNPEAGGYFSPELGLVTVSRAGKIEPIPDAVLPEAFAAKLRKVD